MKSISKEDSIWVDLYNFLFFITSRSIEIRRLQSNIFDPFDELETVIVSTTNKNNLEFLIKKKWLDEKLVISINQLANFVLSIDSNKWNLDSFENEEQWEISRKWGMKLIKKLNINRNGWNNNCESIYFSKDDKPY